MRKILLMAGALALALVPATLARAASPIVGKSITAPAGTVPSTAIFCDDGTGHVALCTFGGGGGGGSLAAQANAAAQSSTEGATTDPLSMNLTRDLRVIAKQNGTWTIGVNNFPTSFSLTGTLPAFAATPTFNLGTAPTLTANSTLQAAENHVGTVGGTTVIAGCAASPCFTTTSATTAWSTGQIIGDSTLAAGVTRMSFASLCRVSNGTGMIRRIRVKVASDTGFASAAAAGTPVIAYVYRDAPTLTNGDRAAWLTTESNYLGKVPVLLNNHFSDYEKGVGVPVDSSGNLTEINYDCNGTNGPSVLLVAGGAIMPQAGSKAVTVVVEALVN